SDSEDESEPSSSSTSTSSIGISANGSSVVIPSFMTDQVLQSIRESSCVEYSTMDCELNDEACIYGRVTAMMLIDLTDNVVDRSKFRDAQKRISNLLELNNPNMNVPMFDQSELETYCFQFGHSVAVRLRCIRATSINDFDNKVQQLYKIIASCRQRPKAHCCFRCITRPFVRLHRRRHKPMQQSLLAAL
ncbi:hypothetical protein Tcan_07012, partial [Toxocara canis]